MGGKGEGQETARLVSIIDAKKQGNHLGESRSYFRTANVRVQYFWKMNKNGCAEDSGGCRHVCKVSLLTYRIVPTGHVSRVRPDARIAFQATPYVFPTTEK